MVPPTTPAGPGLRPALHLAAAVLLGQAIVAQGTAFSPAGVGAVVAAISLVVLALFLPDAFGQRHGRTATAAVVAVGVAIAFWRLPLVGLYWQLPAARPRVGPFVLLAVASAVLAAAVVVGRWASAAVPILLVTFTLMGAFYLGLSPNPRIDVYVVQKLGCQALLRGADPYAITFPNPYAPDTHFFPPGLVVGGRVQCGYPYPTVPLLMTTAAEAVAGDVRYAHLIAYVTAAALVAYGFRRRPGGGRAGAGAAVLLLFAPGVFHLLENAWIEPVLILLVAVATVAASRGWVRTLALAAGLLLVAKQYAPLTAPAFLLLLPRPWRAGTVGRAGVRVAVVGLGVTLPFVLWNPGAFVRSLTVLNVGMVRADSLSVLPALRRVVGDRVPLLAFPAMAAAAAGGLVLWQGKRSPAGFAAGFALVCLCTFAFSPLAFGNYYALAVGALAVSAAADG